MESLNSFLANDNQENLNLCFLLDDNIYSLNAKNVLEVANLPLLNTPQKLSEYIVGILNYNDMFINVVDIRKIFALPSINYTLSNKIIIIKGEESLFAIIVDNVTDFFSVEMNAIQRVVGESCGSIIKTFFKKDEQVVNIIDIPLLENVVKKAHSSLNMVDYTSLFPQDEESVCILQKRRQLLANIPTMNIDTTVYGRDQYIVFKLQEHKYCLYSVNVRELITLKNYRITKIPYTPDYILGIINLKGSFYSVLDLNSFIGFGNNEQPSRLEEGKVIVLESNDLKLAILVDDIVNIINLAKENLVFKNDKNLDSMFVKAEAYISNEVYNIFNVEKLLNDDRLFIDNVN